MNGVPLARVAGILGRAMFLKGMFGRSGAIKVICKQIEKSCLENDIAMVKALLRTIAVQDTNAFNEIQEILSKELSPEELSALLR